MDIRTKSVHNGVYKDKSYNSVTTPIYPSSTFYFDEMGKSKGYVEFSEKAPLRGNPFTISAILTHISK